MGSNGLHQWHNFLPCCLIILFLLSAMTLLSLVCWYNLYISTRLNSFIHWQLHEAFSDQWYLNWVRFQGWFCSHLCKIYLYLSLLIILDTYTYICFTNQTPGPLILETELNYFRMVCTYHNAWYVCSVSALCKELNYSVPTYVCLM